MIQKKKNETPIQIAIMAMKDEDGAKRKGGIRIKKLLTSYKQDAIIFIADALFAYPNYITS